MSNVPSYWAVHSWLSNKLSFLSPGCVKWWDSCTTNPESSHSATQNKDGNVTLMPELDSRNRTHYQLWASSLQFIFLPHFGLGFPAIRLWKRFYQWLTDSSQLNSINKSLLVSKTTAMSICVFSVSTLFSLCIQCFSIPFQLSVFALAPPSHTCSSCVSHLPLVCLYVQSSVLCALFIRCERKPLRTLRSDHYWSIDVQGCQTLFHQGPHERYDGSRRASCN